MPSPSTVLVWIYFELHNSKNIKEMGGLKVEFHYQVLSIILYEKNSKNINSVLIRKFCLVNSIQLLTQKLKTCSRLYCCFLGKNTFLKVSKFQKQIFLFSFEPKSERNCFLISALASKKGSNQKNKGTLLH